MKSTALLLVAVIAAAGCIGGFDPFGGNVIKVQTRSTEEGVRDIIVVKDIHTIPNSPLLPDQEVVLSFVVENRDKIHPAKNVVIDLFNAPGFRDTATKQLCNSGAGVCKPEGGVECVSVTVVGQAGSTQCRISSLLPGEERLIQYTLLAPSREQIANIRTQARLDFKVLYDFESTMNFVIPAVNKDEVIRRQREGETITMVFDKSFSSGPVRVDVEPLGVNYLLDGFETILLFHIKNVGSGNIRDSEIPCYGGACSAAGSSEAACIEECKRQRIADDAYCEAVGCGIFAPGTQYFLQQEQKPGFEVAFPRQLEVRVQKGDVLEEIFGQPQPSAEGGQVFRNLKKEIQIFRDKSQTSLRFPVRLSPATLQEFRANQVPFRSYEIKSAVIYTYELRHFADVAINIFENV